MTKQLAPEFWHALRAGLEKDLSQEEIVIRAQEIIFYKTGMTRH
jgi:hypothetical protein